MRGFGDLDRIPLKTSAEMDQNMHVKKLPDARGLGKLLRRQRYLFVVFTQGEEYLLPT